MLADLLIKGAAQVEMIRLNVTVGDRVGIKSKKKTVYWIKLNRVPVSTTPWTTKHPIIVPVDFHIIALGIQYWSEMRLFSDPRFCGLLLHIYVSKFGRPCYT